MSQSDWVTTFCNAWAIATGVGISVVYVAITLEALAWRRKHG